MIKYGGRYDPLKAYLLAQTASRLPMTFSGVEKTIGAKLPRSAKAHRAWWSNDTGHVQAKAWLDAGYRAEQVDKDAGTLVFARDRNARGFADEAEMFEGNKPGEPKAVRHPMIGAMKGTFTIEPGWDLTKPALDEDELAAWEASLDRKADLIDEMLSKKRR